MMMYSGMSMSTPGNIWDTRKAMRPVRRPGKRNREKAYPAVEARNTPTTVVAAATTAEFSSQRPKGWSANTPAKLDSEISLGQGMMARSRSKKVGSAGSSTKARVCWPENATVSTQRIG
jgi:hypothetical protein